MHYFIKFTLEGKKMYNKVVLVGNLTRDIELINTSNGLTVAKTAIATSKNLKQMQANKKKRLCL